MVETLDHNKPMPRREVLLTTIEPCVQDLDVSKKSIPK